MLNTKKLLYILPEVAYITEVLPDKKPFSFVVHSFTQVNGLFLEDENFVAANIIKLFGKLEKDEQYHVILPDFLFTNTIVSIKEKSDQAIKEELKNKLLPELGLKAETHLLDSSVLNEIRGVSRVQLSAIEKEILAPMRVAAHASGIKIAGLSPLSWVIKSLVSLEPSITVLQMGSHLYTCEHYIGIDQPSFSPVSEPEAVVEAIKTLKGSEPSIQTVYLLGNSLVEEKLREGLGKILPVQQLAHDNSDQEKMPSYVREVVEYSAKTLSITDYPVPIFPLARPSEEELEKYKKDLAAVNAPEDDDDELPAVLPKPATPTSIAPPKKEAVVKEEMKEEVAPKADEKDEEAENKEDKVENAVEKAVVASAAIATVQSIAPAAAAAATTEMEAIGTASTKEDFEEISSKDVAQEPKILDTEKDKDELKPEKVVEPSQTPMTMKKDKDIDLTQFVQAQSATELPAKKEVPVTKTPVVLPTIKNKSGVQHMLKMIFITLAVFCVTVAVGVGVGLAILKFSGSSETAETPPVEVEATPTPTATPEPSATPTPSATASAKPANLKILVVNATTKAGYAGTFKSKIEAAKLGTVTAANAKEKYDGGFLAYMKTEDTSIIQRLKDATQVAITVDKKAAAEDPQNKYDLILILGE